MSEHAFFYNSHGGDRKYDASSMEKWLRKFFTTGVFFGDLAVSANNNMTVTVATGEANINGKVKLFEETTTLTIETADPTNPRIDAIVVERNDDDRDFYLKVKKGTAEASPTAPTPTRAGGVYQLVLAHIEVDAGAASIVAADITDKRDDTSLCGIVQGTVNNFAYGTEDLVAGTTDLATGTFYFKYI